MSGTGKHRGFPPVALIFYSARRNQYGLNVLAGALEPEEKEGVCSLFFSRNLEETLTLGRQALQKGQRVLVAWSFMTPEFPARRTELHQFRAALRSDSLLHCCGGPHPSALPETMLQAGWDLAAVGEGEQLLRTLVRRLAHDASIEDLPGLAWRVDDRIHRNLRGPEIVLDDYPPFAPRHRRFNPIEITRGCIYACKFCQTPFLFRARFRHRSVDRIVEAVREMQKAGLHDIRFITPSALSYGTDGPEPALDRVEELLDAVRRTLGPQGRVFFGSFPSEVRPEHITPASLRLLKKYVNNDNLIIGAQTGSDRLLQISGRGHTVEQARAAVRYTLEAGFQANVDLIFGMPGETEEDRRQTLQFALELVEMGARIHAHTFLPLPGTPWARKPPGCIPVEWQRLFGRLSAAGKLYGSWKQQAELAQWIATYIADDRAQKSPD